MHRGQFLSLAHRDEIPEAGFAAELTEIAAGIKSGRTDPGHCIVCQLVGMGSSDLAVAPLAYQRIMSAAEDVTTVDMMG